MLLLGSDLDSRPSDAAGPQSYLGKIFITTIFITYFGFIMTLIHWVSLVVV